MCFVIVCFVVYVFLLLPLLEIKRSGWERVPVADDAIGKLDAVMGAACSIRIVDDDGKRECVP